MSVSVSGAAARGVAWAEPRVIAAGFFALLALMALLPAVFPVPRASDLINHWARLTVLTAPAGDPILNAYRVEWGAIPNLGIDVLYLALAPLLSAQSVARLAFALSFVLPALGALALHRALHPRMSPTILFATLLSYNLVSTAGLVNYGFGVGVALLALAWRVRAKRRLGRDLIVLNLFGLALFFCHLIALAGFCLLFGLMEASPRSGERWFAGWRRALMAPLYVALAVALVALMPPMPSVFSFSSQKAQMIAAPFYGVSWSDAALAAAGVALLGLAVLRRALLVAPPARWALAGFVLAAALSPPAHGATVLIDARLMVFAVYFALAAIAAREPQRLARPLTLFVAGLAVVRLAALAPAWSDYDHRVAEMRQALAVIPLGSRALTVTPAHCDDRELPLDYNLSAFAAIDRRSFVNTLFAGAGMQPIRIRDAEIADAPEMAMSEAWLTGETAHAQGGWAAAYRNWRDHFDAVIEIHGACTSALSAPGLERAASSAIADVFLKK